jgi:hypothetical protein
MRRGEMKQSRALRHDELLKRLSAILFVDMAKPSIAMVEVCFACHCDRRRTRTDCKLVWRVYDAACVRTPK